MTPRVIDLAPPAASPADIPGLASFTPPEALPKSEIIAATTARRPQPMALTAASERLTRKGLESRRKASKGAGWQRDAWDMYSLVGEQRFLVNVLASRGAQGRLFVGRLPADEPTAEPEQVDDRRLQAALDLIGSSSAGREQIMRRMFMSYLIAGEGYLVGIPQHIIAKAAGEDPDPYAPRGPEVSLTDLEWRTLSVSEVKVKTEETVELRLVEGMGKPIEVHIDDIYLMRSWTPHPEHAWEADSPTRSSLPVLRELVAATMAISSQLDSRLAGAGILAVSAEARKAMMDAMGMDPEEDPDADPFADALIDAMSTAIEDRASAAAYVPLVVTVPGKPGDHIQHFDISSSLDAELRPLREEAIRRLALGQDAPPEILLGMNSMNHWGAWLVREDVVSTHLEPVLALFCDTLTVQYLRPLMAELGYSPDVIADTIVWYDVEHMIVRPSRGADASSLHAAGELSGEALRRAHGFDETDAPQEQSDKLDPAVQLAFDMVAKAPSLAQNPGLPELVVQIKAVLSGTEAAAAAAQVDTDEAIVEAEAGEEVSSGDDAPADGPPEEVADPEADQEPPAITASAMRARRSPGDIARHFPDAMIETNEENAQ